MSEKEFIVSYWSGRSEDFSKLRKAELQSIKYKRWEEEIKRHLPEHASLKILDVGCGSGFLSILLGNLGHEVVGIDLTAEMIEQAKVTIGNKLSNVTVQVMDAEKLMFEEEVFDVVIARNVTWNLPNPAIAYQEWLRVLKKKGILLNYDAEYAKDHQNLTVSYNHAHNRLSIQEIDQCNQIYQMLEISGKNRPDWDIQVLKEQKGVYLSVDLLVGSRIYQEKDEFFIPTPMFLVKAVKE